MKQYIAIITSLFLLISSAHAQQKLRVFSLNIWQETTQVKNGFNQLVDVIIQSDADIVALSEIRNYKKVDFQKRLLAALKDKEKTYHGEYAVRDVSVISKFPITKTEPVPSSDKNFKPSIYAFHLELPNKKPFIVCSAHLIYTNYAVYLPRGYDGLTFKMIDPDKDGIPNPVTDIEKLHAMDKASTRDEAIAGFLKYTKIHPDADVILAGDFNEASHYDWTKEAANLYDRNGVTIEWKNSLTLKNAGYVDTYREIYPDPVKNPGFTWPSHNSSNHIVNYTPLADDRDRIDYIYYNKKNLQATAAFIAGSNQYYLKGEPTTAIGTEDQFILDQTPWMSDHKGVIVDFIFAE